MTITRYWFRGWDVLIWGIRSGSYGQEGAQGCHCGVFFKNPCYLNILIRCPFLVVKKI